MTAEEKEKLDRKVRKMRISDYFQGKSKIESVMEAKKRVLE